MENLPLQPGGDKPSNVPFEPDRTKMSTDPLPGTVPTDRPLPTMIDLSQPQPRPKLPEFWTDSANIIRQILDVFEKKGLPAAQRLQAWLKEEQARP